jgi:DNA-binding MarR family transcriptional regulator
MALFYRRTEAGRKAWDSQSSNVPLEYRRVLGLFTHDTDPREVRATLGWSEGALNDVLEELEEKGMLERYETDERVDLDFTGSFSVAGLDPAARGRA